MDAQGGDFYSTMLVLSVFLPTVGSTGLHCTFVPLVFLFLPIRRYLYRDFKSLSAGKCLWRTSS